MFDVILANPPFDNGLHEKFLISFFNISKEIVSVQPVSWLLGQNQKTKITSIIDNTYSEIETINPNDFFDANIGGNISINYINTTSINKSIVYNGIQYKKCKDINRISDDAYLQKFLSLIQILISDNLHNHIKATPENPIMSMYSHKEYNPDPNWWTLEIPTIRGHVSANNQNIKLDDFYTLLSKNDKFTETKIKQVKDFPKTNKIIDNKNVLSLMYVNFNEKIEVYNFINYLKTDFCRICLYIKKDTQNVATGCLRCIPWFDFSDPIFSKTPKEIDDYLFTKYNISNDIRKHIEEIIPDYYKIR